MLTTIASTKSTVLGVRLDHERRAWIESTAAAQGLSVRGLVERIIDEARAAEAEGQEPVLSFLKREPGPVAEEPPSRSPAAPGIPAEAASGGSGIWAPGAEELPARGEASGNSAAIGESPRAELTQLISLSGQLARGVVRLSAACARSAAHGALAPWRCTPR